MATPVRVTAAPQNVRFSFDQQDLVERVAATHGVSKSLVVRAAVELASDELDRLSRNEVVRLGTPTSDATGGTDA